MFDIMDEQDGMYEAQEAAYMRLRADIADDELEEQDIEDWDGEE